MIDGSEKGNRQLAFELQNSQVCEKRSKASIPQTPSTFCNLDYILENGKIRFFSFLKVECIQNRDLRSMSHPCGPSPWTPS